ncbi:hypothetical protein LNP74_05250 [Klebsiella pneumoniae subsp. pneumoniae]|nr:hypothetical protein [Klebsiella pneumoniae subsp. pneumoniae]
MTACRPSSATLRLRYAPSSARWRREFASTLSGLRSGIRFASPEAQRDRGMTPEEAALIPLFFRLHASC